MPTFIYCLIDPRNDSIRYVGKTINLRTRFTMHLLEKENTRKNAWLKSLSRSGARPVMEVIEEIEGDDDSEWQISERFWISYFRFLGVNLTNHDSGGNAGRRQCQETKDKIRAKALGRKMSPEAVEKMKASKAANFTSEVRERFRRAQLGKKRTPEERARLSAALTGRTVSEETRRKIGAANKISREAYLAANPPKCRQPRTPRERQPTTTETRAKMRRAALERKYSPEGIAAIRAANIALRGRKRSPEVRARMSEAKRLGWARKKALQSNLNPVTH